MAALLLLLPLGGMAATDATAITATELATPAGARAATPSLTTGPDGAVWLSWIDPGAPGEPGALRLAPFAPATARWGGARTVVANRTVSPQPADIPQVAIDGRGRIDVLRTDGHGGAELSASADRGATWSTPQRWVRDGHAVEKFSLARLADGRVLAAWLDGRQRGGRAQHVYARIVGEPETTDHLIDDRVCDCCPTSLTPFLDGGARLAYRGRTTDEVRDVLTARFRGDGWDEPRVLNADEWRVNACPVNGPRLFSDGSRVAAAWFTAAASEPRVNVSFSPDAGKRWLMPLRVDHGQPVGHVDTVLLHDGTVLVIWLERDGSVWLSRIAPDFAVHGELEVAPRDAAALAGLPRLALLRDYAGGRSGAQLLVAYTRAAGGVGAVLVNVPEGQLLTSERNCDCLPTPEELSGFALRGTIIAVTATTARVRHAEVPGVFSAGEHDFILPPAALSPADAGRPFLARIERRAGAWALSDVRFLGSPAPSGRR